MQTLTPDLGAYGVKLSSLTYLLFRAAELSKTVTRLQAGGYHAAYINNLEEFLGYAAQIGGAVGELISIIERAYGEE
ncbi:MAG TPA: hypothetical protein VHQ65_11210 [Thermoanaerobaculia bacterium]|nr:hypothetical protein [Thermoanaerobaculia bacterium]